MNRSLGHWSGKDGGAGAATGDAEEAAGRFRGELMRGEEALGLGERENDPVASVNIYFIYLCMS